MAVLLHDRPEAQQRWYAIKIFERDDKVLEQLNIPEATKKHIEQDIEAAEKEMDDDAESIITNERSEEHCFDHQGLPEEKENRHDHF